MSREREVKKKCVWKLKERKRKRKRKNRKEEKERKRNGKKDMKRMSQVKDK
jgi:hypothetical protein